jgi:hypothetical protein
LTFIRLSSKLHPIARSLKLTTIKKEVIMTTAQGADSEVFVWDGTLENLPAVGKEFFYKGERYNTKECPCGCGCLYIARNDRMAFELTIRTFGPHQMVKMWNIIIRSGRIEELIMTRKDPKTMLALFDDVVERMPIRPGDPEEKVQTYLKSIGTNFREFIEACVENKLLWEVVFNSTYAPPEPPTGPFPESINDLLL